MRILSYNVSSFSPRPETHYSLCRESINLILWPWDLWNLSTVWLKSGECCLRDPSLHFLRIKWYYFIMWSNEYIFLADRATWQDWCFQYPSIGNVLLFIFHVHAPFSLNFLALLPFVEFVGKQSTISIMYAKLYDSVHHRTFLYYFNCNSALLVK